MPHGGVRWELDFEVWVVLANLAQKSLPPVDKNAQKEATREGIAGNCTEKSRSGHELSDPILMPFLASKLSLPQASLDLSREQTVTTVSWVFITAHKYGWN